MWPGLGRLPDALALSPSVWPAGHGLSSLMDWSCGPASPGQPSPGSISPEVRKGAPAFSTVGKGPQDFIQEMLLSSQEAVLWPRRLPPHEVPAEGARARDSPHPPGFRSQKSSEQTDTAGHVTVLRASEEARVTQGLVSSRTPHPGLASSVSCWSLTASVRTVWGELSTSCPRAHCECG